MQCEYITVVKYSDVTTEGSSDHICQQGDFFYLLGLKKTFEPKENMFIYKLWNVPSKDSKRYLVIILKVRAKLVLTPGLRK